MIKVIQSKLENLIRLVYINSITIKKESVILVEYPKSGGTWLGQLVSEYLDIPFPRNKFPTTKRSLFHGHYLPKNRIVKNKKIILLVRDGRDTLVSFYHHQLLWNDKNKLNPSNVEYYRKTVGFDNYENVKKNMAAYIKYSFLHKPPKFQHYLFHGNWFQFNDAWLKEAEKSNNIYLVRYEDLLSDTQGTMRTLIKNFFNEEEINEERLAEVVHKYSFENQTKRKKGDENTNSFLRKGISGDWKNYFGASEIELFKQYSKDMLVRLKYEENEDW